MTGQQLHRRRIYRRSKCRGEKDGLTVGPVEGYDGSTVAAVIEFSEGAHKRAKYCRSGRIHRRRTGRVNNSCCTGQNNSHKDHITGQLLSQSKDSHKEHVAEGKVSHKDPIWSTHAAVIIKYVGAAKRFTQGSCDGSTVCCTDELFTQGPHDGSTTA